MKFRCVIGDGDYLNQVIYAYKDKFPDDKINPIYVKKEYFDNSDYHFLKNLPPEIKNAFVAVDERFGNFKRMELMQAVMERGLKLDTLISINAYVPSDVAIGMNVFIGPNVVIGHGCQIDFNTVIHASTTIGPHVHIKSSCWLESGVQIGKGVEIGAHSTLRTGVVLAPNIKVGRHCELGWIQHYDQNIPDRTTFDSRYSSPIYIYGK